MVGMKTSTRHKPRNNLLGERTVLVSVWNISKKHLGSTYQRSTLLHTSVMDGNDGYIKDVRF